ncbi:MAG TPA: hypothetical protein VM100_07975, partial [Longimicrobiales bacterium]|nr:hypothetical protein [Longimicrobiales bacterium]
GNPAYAGEFQAQTEQGVIQGLATFLSFGGATYQILGYTSQARYNSYASSFDRTMSSFTTLTDQSALNIRPNRIDVVKAPTTMTYSQFNARYPSVVPINELLIINQLDNANERITAGTELKRVIVQQ